jgi:hypothetical protein
MAFMVIRMICYVLIFVRFMIYGYKNCAEVIKWYLSIFFIFFIYFFLYKSFLISIS